MLYWSARPNVSTFGCGSVVGLPLSSTPLELLRVGRAMPALPVKANGRRYRADSGRSPNPLPKNTDGVIVLNDSAPTRLDPDPPMSQSAPTERMVSCSSLL